MKKLIAVLIAIALTMGLVGCGGAQSSAEVSSSIPAVEETEEIEEVDPEFKAALDQYEAFINGYCDFLEMYLKADTDTQLSMMEDYTTWMSQYAEVMDAVRTLDACQDEMTPAQLSYYIEVTARVSQRMIEFSERCE